VSEVCLHCFFELQLDVDIVCVFCKEEGPGHWQEDKREVRRGENGDRRKR
jgi:hypothetical protein